MSIIKRTFLLIIFSCLIFNLFAIEESMVGTKSVRADSIMNEVTKYAKSFSSFVRDFDGEVYIKGTTEIKNSNFVFKVFPDLFPFTKKSEGSVFEILNKVTYTAPNKFCVSPVALHSTIKNPVKNQEDITPLLNLNIYDETSFNDRYLMPGSVASKGIYLYRLDSIVNISGHDCYKIRFRPRRNNLKLLKGWLYIQVGTPFILCMEAEGRLNISHFNIKTYFGSKFKNFMLPQKSEIVVTYNIMNNISEYNYYCKYEYTNVNIETNPENYKESDNLDLTKYYSIKGEKVPIIKEDIFWEKYREKPFTEKENSLFGNSIRKDSIKSLDNDTLLFDYKKFSEFLVTNTYYGNQSLKWKYAGIINPSLFGYSKTNGIVIRQRLQLTKNLPRDRFINITPVIGYSFKHKELFYSITNNWLFSPQKLGMFSLSFKSGNKGFSSKFINKVNEVLDSTNYNFDNLNIKYYRDYDLQGNFTHEVTNGLILNTGISYFFHNALKDKNEFIPEQGDYMFKKRYADFVPYIRLTFTPNQYYRYIGRRKIYLETNRPTFSLEYAKGISNVFASNSSFNKMELDIHQRIPFNVLRSLSYRVGAGAFFRQKDEYFVNFRNFQRSNYPSSWSDPIGGVFNLLDNRWYYSSPQYVQLHLMYDSPFLLLHFFKSISKYVLSERLYFSQLYTPEKPSYTELGYGIGNYIFNVAGFVSFHKYKVNEFGFRFTFELDKYW